LIRGPRTAGVLGRLVRLACARPAATVAAGAALAVVALAYTVAGLGVATSTRALLPQGLPFVERYTEYEREFGELDDIAIVVEAPSLAEARLYASRLVPELQTGRVRLGRVAYRIDPKQFEGRALLYLSPERLAEIRDRIVDYQDFLEAFAARPTLDRLVEGVADQLAAAFVGGFLDLGLSDPRSALDLRFVRDLVAQISTRVNGPAPYHSPWGGLFAVDSDEDSPGAGYFISDDQRLLFILAEPSPDASSFAAHRDAIDGIRAVVTSLAPRFPDVRVGVTGNPALSSDEMVTAFRDAQRATLVAFTLALALLVVAFMRVGKPLVMLGVLAMSLAWSLGAATLFVGHLSLFSVMFIPIVIGIGIDYGIYFAFRYEEERARGRGVVEALEITAMRAGPGMLLAAATASAAFYVLLLTDFRGLQELGFVAGTAILLAWVVMTTVFPAALALLDGREADGPATPVAPGPSPNHAPVPIVDRLIAYPRTILALAAVATLVSAAAFGAIRFDYNLLNLQAAGTESVDWERRIRETSRRSGFAALASAWSLEELRDKQERFARLGSVSEIDSALLLIPDRQDEKQRIIADFAPVVNPVRVARPMRLDFERLVTALETLGRRLGIAAGEAPPGEVQRTLAAVRGDVADLVATLRRTDRDVSEPALTVLQRQIYRDFVQSFQRLQANLTPQRVGMDDLPDALRRKFVSERGRFLMQIHPAVDIWDRDGAARFVGELRTVDPEVTGTPIITFEAIRLMERAYQQGLLYAIALVVLITAVMLRRARETILALFPLGLGLTWTLGLMWVVGLPFNLGNVFALPLIVGAAAEYGLNIVARFMEGRDHGGAILARSTTAAVLVNGLTTIIGFGSLMLAAHRGIHGLGLLLTLGAASNLIAALVVLPVLLQRFGGLPARPASLSR
jgi:hopanoid biosynthesis associated RND transporter like protein HpnN